MESSHRDPLNNMAEHRSILNNNQNTRCSLLFQDRPTVCSATSMKSSRRDVLNDMAWPTSKNNQNTYHPRFGFTPKTDIAFAKSGFWFYCVIFQKHVLFIMNCGTVRNPFREGLNVILPNVLQYIRTVYILKFSFSTSGVLPFAAKLSRDHSPT